MSSISNSMFRNFERTSPQTPKMSPKSGRLDWQFISQRDDDGVERDELSDGSEYNPKSRDNNRPTVKKPKEFNVGRNKVKLDRNKRALVRALAKRGKWDHEEIAAVFLSEDANFYKQSDLEELISEWPPAPEKKRKRKTQVIDIRYARSPKKSAQEVFCRQRVVVSPSASVPIGSGPNPNTARGIFRMFRDEATLVHGEKVHSILEEIGIEDDETMLAVLTMDDERLNDMLQEARRLNLVEKYSVIQAMRNFGRNHKIVK
ncbi:hypothetical protein EV702DRAFT_1238743 [Suillus placidus]|uniref:Uncharacterized protein n=1 Tax=Suillus placidus TaxID=48579 RepID=A0A9P7D7G9_9AGAM|nr:hypothetical protein EV702DRAFT_1238743 [Suillus placidus]